MKILSLDVYHVEMPYREPWVTSFGSSFGTGSIIVKMTTDTAVGWAETAPCRSALYSPEYTKGAFGLISGIMAPRLVGQQVASGQQMKSLLAVQKGNPFAKSALDVAWWDAYAKSQNLPLWKLIGGQPDTVSVGADLSIRPTVDETLQDVDAAVEAGFTRVKLKFGRDGSIDLLRRIRNAHPDVQFHIDCNTCFTMDDLPVLKALDEIGLSMIEQPLSHDDLIRHAELQKVMATPICLDESIDSVEKARKALEIGACRWVNIKIGRVGGITPAVEIHDLCREHGVPCWVGSMLESGLGQGASLALATLPNIRYPSDIFPSDRFYKEDLAVPELTLSAPSKVAPPDTPGLGFEPNLALLDRLTIDHAHCA